MSCPDCEIAQKPDLTNKVTGLTEATYIRVGNSNVLISACRWHLQDLITLYRKALHA